MKSVGYMSPFVPAEWVAAHGLRPMRLELSPPDQAGASMGLCPLAQAVIESATRSTGVPPVSGMGILPMRPRGVSPLVGSPVDALVLVDSCDQLRRSAEMIESDPAAPPVFLLHLPRAWQSPGAEAFYQDELRRLGRFLVHLGGTTPSNDQLSAVMLKYQAARDQLQQSAPMMSGSDFVRALDELHTTGRFTPPPSSGPRAGIPLAVLGDCLLRQELTLLDLIESKGGRIAVNGTDAGSRGLPGSFDLAVMKADPLAALAAGYYRIIPFISARPNAKFFEWLEREMPAHGVRGIILLQRLWCDLWQAELPRFKEATGLPVLELDMQETPASRGMGILAPRAISPVNVSPAGTRAETALGRMGETPMPPRLVTRVEAFLEVLR